tara:strand:+ start:377 stop:946 length:570 start_codon:yes stop_codon:yes gene_type:complete
VKYFDIRLYWYAKSQLIYRWFFKEFHISSYFGTPLFLKGSRRIHISKRVRVFAGSRIELHGNKSKLIIEENTSIGHNLHLVCGGKIVIGKNTTISSNVFINDIDNDYLEINKSIMEQKQIVKETYIGENSFIGFGSSIQAGTILEKNVIVGANSFVKGHFPKYSVIGGVPAKILKIYNHKTKKWESVEK